MNSQPKGPLAGVRVLELGQLIAGPFCGQILADFGADVVKVEQPMNGDPMRDWGVVHDGVSLSWSVIARGKRCITADLHDQRDRDFVLNLVREADVVVENFRPGTLERFGMGYDVLEAINPQVVLTRVSGFGQDGPYAARPGYGSIGEAMGGLRYLVGEADRPPSRMGVSIGDLLAGLHAALGTLLALRERDSRGRGQVVDVSIYESVLALTESLVSDFAVAGLTRERSGAVLPGVAPSNVYATRDEQTLLIAANQDSVFARLATAMGRPEMSTAPEYATHIARGVHQLELDAEIERWTSTLSAAEVIELLDRHAVPVGQIYRAKDMLLDPHFIARHSIIEVEHDTLGALAMQGVAPRLSRTPGAVRWPGAAHGQHDAELRRGWPSRPGAL